MGASLYFGGLPTEPDIRALRKAFPEADMEPGTVIPYREVAMLLGIAKTSNRFRTVTNRWRRLVERETQRIVIGTEPGVGFKILDNTQKLNMGHSKLTSAARNARRAYVLASRLDDKTPLTEEEKARRDVLQRYSASVVAAAQIKGNTDLPKLIQDDE